jgi:hypothetical protein
MFLNIKDIALILLNIAFVATFLTIFFFTYASKVEKNIVESQMQYITNNFLDNISLFIPDNKRKLISSMLNNVKIPDLSSQDNKVRENNNKIMYSAFKIVLGFFLSTILVTALLSYYYDFSYKEIFLQSLLIIAVVATIEYSFLTKFGSRFISADVNFVKYKIIDTIQKNK